MFPLCALLVQVCYKLAAGGLGQGQTQSAERKKGQEAGRRMGGTGAKVAQGSGDGSMRALQSTLSTDLYQLLPTKERSMRRNGYAGRRRGSMRECAWTESLTSFLRVSLMDCRNAVLTAMRCSSICCRAQPRGDSVRMKTKEYVHKRYCSTERRQMHQNSKA